MGDHPDLILSTSAKFQPTKIGKLEWNSVDHIVEIFRIINSRESSGVLSQQWTI